MNDYEEVISDGSPSIKDSKNKKAQFNNYRSNHNYHRKNPVN